MQKIYAVVFWKKKKETDDTNTYTITNQKRAAAPYSHTHRSFVLVFLNRMASVDEARLRAEYACFAQFAGLPIHNNKGSTNNENQKSSSVRPTFGGDLLHPASSSSCSPLSSASSTMSRAQAPPGACTALSTSAATNQMLQNQCLKGSNNDQSSSLSLPSSSSSASASPTTVFNSLPLPLVKLVVDDIKLKLFRLYGEGAAEYLLRYGALPPLTAVGTLSVPSPSTASSATVCGGGVRAGGAALGQKRSREEDEGDAIVGCGTIPVMATAPLPSSSAFDVSVKRDEMLSPNSTIARMLAKQAAAKQALEGRLSGVMDGGGGDEGGGEGSATATSCPLVAGTCQHPRQQQSVYCQSSASVLPSMATVMMINAKFPSHRFSRGLLSREEVCRVINTPLPDPMVVSVVGGQTTAASSSSVASSSVSTATTTTTSLIMPPPGSVGGVPRVFNTFSSSHNTIMPSSSSALLARFPMCEAERLLFLKEQEELLTEAIASAKQHNADLEREVFLTKDKCERTTKLWRTEMGKEESTLKSYEMRIIEVRRAIDKARMELKRSMIEEERLSKIIRTTKAK